MSKKRDAGKGSVTELRNGRFWARSAIQPSGQRESFGTWATREDAEQAAARGVWMLENRPRDGSPTFELFAREVLDLREEEGVRGIAQERGRFEHHLATCSLASLSLKEITSPHVATLARTLMRKNADDKRTPRKVSRKTVQRCLSFVSAVFTEAISRGLVSVNPCTGVKVRKRADEGTHETWDYLTADEQHTFLTCKQVPEWFRLLVQFAIGTGVRQGEQWNLELSDLHVDGDEPHAVVRYGSKGRAPKSGKIRTVPLFGLALDAATRWLALLPTYAPNNPLGLVFPTVTGCRRGSGSPERTTMGTDEHGKPVAVKVDLFHYYTAVAGISRRLRWHDLRHTCASSLVGGFWGEPWSLEEVKEMLGHSSIIVTQIYSHLGASSLKRAAKKVSPVGYALVTGPSPGASGLAAISNDLDMVGRAGLEPATYGLKGYATCEEKPEVRYGRPHRKGTPVTNEATSHGARLIALINAGKLDEARALALEVLT